MILNQLKVGTDEELEKINKAAWHILEHTGMRIFSDELLNYVEGSKIDEETIALKEIERIGFAEKDNFLQSEHTLNHFRDELYFPFLLDNSKRKDKEEEERIIEKANKKWKEVLNSYSPPEVNEELLKRVHKVITRAKKEILF